MTNQTQSSEKGAGICYDENKSYQDSFRSGKARRCARKGGTIKTIFYEVKSQRKDERYMYKYVDNAGNMKYVCSLKPVKTDTRFVPMTDKVKAFFPYLDKNDMPMVALH